MEPEIWKPAELLGHDYEVSNLGNVRWLRQIKSQRKREGYPIVSAGKRRKNVMVHRVVATAFIPKVEGKPHINHKDGVKTNNTVENLEWVTPQENIAHAWRTGLMANVSLAKQGEKHPMCRLTEETVRGIFALRDDGMLHSAIATLVGVGRRQVSYILSGKKWKHLGLATTPS